MTATGILIEGLEVSALERRLAAYGELYPRGEALPLRVFGPERGWWRLETEALPRWHRLNLALWLLGQGPEDAPATIFVREPDCWLCPHPEHTSFLSGASGDGSLLQVEVGAALLCNVPRLRVPHPALPLTPPSSPVRELSVRADAGVELDWRLPVPEGEQRELQRSLWASLKVLFGG